MKPCYNLEAMKPDSVKARLIHNPTAGPRDVQRGLKRVRSYLRRQGWSVELRMTEKPGDATALARAAAQANCDVVIAAGGDGTVSEVVNGLVGTQAALGVGQRRLDLFLGRVHPTESRLRW